MRKSGLMLYLLLLNVYSCMTGMLLDKHWEITASTQPEYTNSEAKRIKSSLENLDTRRRRPLSISCARKISLKLFTTSLTQNLLKKFLRPPPCSGEPSSRLLWLILSCDLWEKLSELKIFFRTLTRRRFLFPKMILRKPIGHLGKTKGEAQAQEG